MKKIRIYVALMPLLFWLAGCGPPKVDRVVEIQPNETAFVVPLEGNTGKQGKFMSVDYLEQQKVAAKRIYLPQTKISTGRYWFSFIWAPTDKVIKVDRQPVTFVWQGSNGIHVESRDSIGFIVGVDITAHIDEKNTALFLYHFPSGDLQKTINNVIKSKATEILSRAFAQYDLEGDCRGYTEKERDNNCTPGAREEKGVIVDQAKKELQDFFQAEGISIDTFGLIGGLEYEDEEIQTAINDNFKSELDIKNKQNERIAQEEINRRKVAMSIAEKEAALNFAQAAKARTEMVNLEINKIEAQAHLKLAEAELAKADKWDGKLPSNIMPEGAGFILNQ